MTFVGMLAISLASVPEQAAIAGDWPTYANARYGYQICYPAELLEPKQEADNGDGRKFLGSGGTEMLVFGQFNSENSSLAEWSNGQAKVYIGKWGRITYRATYSNWMVISGNDGKGFVFYLRSIERDGRFVTLQIRYSARSAATFRPVIEHVAHCMKMSDLPD